MKNFRFPTLAAAAFILIGGLSPALADDSSEAGPGLVGWTMAPAFPSAGPVTSQTQQEIRASVADAERRCAAALNGEQAGEVADRCGIVR